MDWRIFHDFAQILIRQGRDLYANEPLGLCLKKTVYAFDSSTIDLCLSIVPWAKFRRRKAAIKLHTLLDIRGNIPCFIYVFQGKLHDVNAIDLLPIEANSFYVMDRGYLDFKRLYRFTTAGAFFVIRTKSNLDFRHCLSHPVDTKVGLRSDIIIHLKGPLSAKIYPDRLRRISFHDAEKDRRLVFLTNNTKLAAITIAKLYRCRWHIDLFFKWIKQNLRIKAFYCTSDNAVKTQNWIEIAIYVLVAIVRKNLKIERSQSETLQILSLTLFEKMNLFQAFSMKNPAKPDDPCHNQRSLFGL